MAGLIRVGMSGFSYKEWVGDFYPAKTKPTEMLAYYSTRFDAVEINMTFRRQPLEKTIDKWREAVGDEFRFSMKAHQRITHWKKLKDVSEDVEFFVKGASTMGSRLGPILFQTPPTLEFDPVVFDAFCSSMPPGHTYAFEPRHASFADEAVDEILRRHGVARCLNDDVHAFGPYRATGPLAYFRFHRVDYEPGDLEARLELVERLASEGTDVYAFFAHEDNPESVHPALRFQELVRAG